MTIEIEKGKKDDIDELEKLYDSLNDYLFSHINYPGWIKGIYPTRETAVAGIEEDCLFVARMDGRIAGTVILRHQPEPAYSLADWRIDLDYSEILGIYTLAVHPDFLHKKIGRKILDFVFEYSVQKQIKAIRLDVYEKNIPAIKLYESCGFQYIATVDLGYGEYGLNWYKLYQRIL